MHRFDARDMSAVDTREPTCCGARPPAAPARRAAEVDPAGQANDLPTESAVSRID